MPRLDLKVALSQRVYQQRGNRQRARYVLRTVDEFPQCFIYERVISDRSVLEIYRSNNDGKISVLCKKMQTSPAPEILRQRRSTINSFKVSDAKNGRGENVSFVNSVKRSLSFPLFNVKSIELRKLLQNICLISIHQKLQQQKL